MTQGIARAGAVAGGLSLVGIFGYQFALIAVAGQRVSGTTERAAIETYYANDFLAVAVVEQFVVMIAIIVFVAVLAQALAVTDTTRVLVLIGLLAVAAEGAAITTQLAAQAALVVAVDAGGDPTALFRFWDVLYNSGVYALEATWVAAFGLAMRHARAFPRWMPAFSVLVAALLAINMTAIWAGIPDAATLPANMLFGAWFVGGIVGLTRLASSRDLVARPMPA